MENNISQHKIILAIFPDLTFGIFSKESVLIILIMTLSALMSFLCSLWLIKKADKFGLIDVPNSRSSHDKPTPKGGGIGIALGMAAAFGLGCVAGIIPESIRYLSIFCGALAFALLGYVSDRFHITPLIRIIIQTLIAGGVIWFIGYPKSLGMGGLNLSLGHLGILAALIWLVAIINFYNFMDGIDGLAASQGVLAGIGIALFGVILEDNSLIPMGLFLCAATAGFLVLNISPARIFMGDAGSYFIGFYIASFALLNEQLWMPLVLVLGVFIFDTTVTVVRRVIKGERWYRAHRSHFYQRALNLGFTHAQVTLALSFVGAALTLAACFYLKSSAVIQREIVAVSFLCLSGLAVWITSEEREAKIRHVK